MIDWPSRPCGESLQYKLDPIIAQRVKELRLGLNGNRVHSWRALACKVIGWECQHTGSELETLAQWTLDEHWETREHHQ